MLQFPTIEQSKEPMSKIVENQPSVSDNIAWFICELHAYADEESLGKSVSPLLVVSADIKTAQISDEGFRRYKRAVLCFISECLVSAERSIQDAFFMFLLQSSMIDDSREVRSAMHVLLKGRLGFPLDMLSVNIAGALLRSNKTPASSVIDEVFSKAKEQFTRKPDWMLAGVLASAVGRVRDTTYTTDDFIADLAKLLSPEFDNAVRLRNPLWLTLNPPTDAISIIAKVRGIVGDLATDQIIPEQLGHKMKTQLQRRIYHSIH